MSSVQIAGDTSGSVTLQAPSVAGTTVLTLPTTSGTLLTSATGQTLTSPTINGTVTMGATVITSGTAQNTTSGTSIDFTGIPSWVKRITILLQGVSTSGTSGLTLQLGTSTSTETTGYLGSGLNMQSNNAFGAYAVGGAGFLLEFGTFTAAYARMSKIVLDYYGSNIWYMSHNTATFTTTAMTTAFYTSSGVGTKTTGSTLDRVRLTTVGGTDTFDAGTMNILYE